MNDHSGNSGEKMFSLIHYDILDSAFNNFKPLTENSWFAHSHVQKRDEGYEIEIELPGISRSDISVEVVSNMLRVSASRENRMPTYELSYMNNPSKQDKTTTVSYEKSWRLPDETNFENINAKYEAGVLRIEVPVKRPSKRKISVE